MLLPATIGLLAIALVLAVVFLCPYRLVPLLKRLFAGIVWQGSGADPCVPLTIDDGPDPVFTPRILAILQQAQVPATFFLVGERVRRYPEIVRQICQQGHEVANHSDSWARTLSLSTGEFARDLQQAERTLAALPGALRVFRPAGIWIRPSQLRLLGRLGYRCVLGSAYAHDPLRPPAGYISRTILRALRPGVIIVLHDSGGDRSATVRALPAILGGAGRKGLSFVPLSALLKKTAQQALVLS